ASDEGMEQRPAELRVDGEAGSHLASVEEPSHHGQMVLGPCVLRQSPGPRELSVAAGNRGPERVERLGGKPAEARGSPPRIGEADDGRERLLEQRLRNPDLVL